MIFLLTAFPIKVMGVVILAIVVCAVVALPLAFVAALLRAAHVLPAGGPTSGRSRPPIPLALRTRVLQRDNWQCVYCGSKEDLQMDHIIPFSRGGATTFENLETLCGPCNEKKGAK